MTDFKERVAKLRAHHEELLTRKNVPLEWGNGIYTRYKYPILTAEHTPLEWRYDFNEKDNPYLMQRIMMNATLNSGAIKWHGKYLLVVRVEGADRKSFFAVAESPNGVDNFRFWPEPITMPEDVIPATNVYDMRLTAHEDGWIYGVFCAERHDDSQPGDLSAATATAGIARTKDLINWERLPDLKSKSQQRNVVLHPEFVDGKYAFYTRPQDGFIDAGSGGGIGWALVDDIEHAAVLDALADLAHTARIAVLGIEAVCRLCQNFGAGGLARTARACEQVGVCEPVFDDFVFQRGRDMLLTGDVVKGFRSPFAV